MAHESLLKSPLRDALKKCGAVFDTVADREIIRTFGSFDDEYSAFHNSVGIRDLSNEGIIECKGNDTLDYFHRVSTNDVKNLRNGESTRTIFTNENGRIIDYTTLVHCGDTILVVGSGVHERKLLEWLDKYIIIDDVRAASLSGRSVLLEVTGLHADSYINTITGGSGTNMKALLALECHINNNPATLLKLDPVYDIARYWIIADLKPGKNIFEYLLNSASSKTFQFIGSDAYSAFRIERGIPAAPHELNEDYNPHEAGLIDDVSFTKGCFIGQEVIARLDTYDKVQKHLRGLLFREDAPAGDYRLFTKDNKQAGTVTSQTFSPRVKQYIGLGYIRKNYEANGSQLIAKNEHGNAIEVTVTDLPIISR